MLTKFILNFNQNDIKIHKILQNLTTEAFKKKASANILHKTTLTHSHLEKWAKERTNNR